MVEAQADYSEADRLAEQDVELRQRLQSVRVRKPISWKGRKEPAAKTDTEGTDFLISFCNLDHKESNRRLRQLEEGVFFQGQCRCWAENLQCSSHECGIWMRFSMFFSRFFYWWSQRTSPSQQLGNIIHHSSIMWQFGLRRFRKPQFWEQPEALWPFATTGPWVKGHTSPRRVCVSMAPKNVNPENTPSGSWNTSNGHSRPSMAS